jgi:hypothetical protein
MKKSSFELKMLLGALILVFTMFIASVSMAEDFTASITPDSGLPGSTATLSSDNCSLTTTYEITINNSGATISNTTYTAGSTSGVTDTITATCADSGEVVTMTYTVTPEAGEFTANITPGAGPPGSTATLSSENCDGTTSYEITVNNSGATISDNTYTAGSTSGVTDTITATCDATGEEVTLTFTVGIESTWWLPHETSKGGWVASVIVGNNVNSPSSAKLTVRDENGVVLGNADSIINLSENERKLMLTTDGTLETAIGAPSGALANKDFSCEVKSSGLIYVTGGDARVNGSLFMYEGCKAGTDLRGAHLGFTGLFHTYLLLVNTTASTANVTITQLKDDGTTNYSSTTTIPANARETIILNANFSPYLHLRITSTQEIAGYGSIVSFGNGVPDFTVIPLVPFP